MAPRSFLGLALPLFVACAGTTGHTQTTEPSEPSPMSSDTRRPPEGPRTPQPAVAPESTTEGVVAPSLEVSTTSESPSEQDAYERARPLFERYCASCHTTHGERSRRSALRHFNMDSYPLGGHHADEIGAMVRQSLGASGSPATMPRDRPGVIEGDELQVILEWADAFERAHPVDHSGGGHSH